MPTLTIDHSSAMTLQAAPGPCWLRDDSGNLIGYFHPGKPTPIKEYPEGVVPEMSDEEYQRRRLEPGRPLKEILADLEKLK